ncbi:hypothetical protein K501DRAFT_275515 [Backusella circina FSU 941]|nr:hypothetical protein K501DRAFT_275515 [Backusella circina FSU 941]
MNIMIKRISFTFKQVFSVKSDPNKGSRAQAKAIRCFNKVSTLKMNDEESQSSSENEPITGVANVEGKKRTKKSSRSQRKMILGSSWCKQRLIQAVCFVVELTSLDFNDVVEGVKAKITLVPPDVANILTSIDLFSYKTFRRISSYCVQNIDFGGKGSYLVLLTRKRGRNNNGHQFTSHSLDEFSNVHMLERKRKKKKISLNVPDKDRLTRNVRNDLTEKVVSNHRKLFVENLSGGKQNIIQTYHDNWHDIITYMKSHTRVSLNHRIISARAEQKIGLIGFSSLISKDSQSLPPFRSGSKPTT